MNKEKLREIVNQVEMITTNLQYANEKTLVVYNINGENGEALFKKRLGKIRPLAIILNKKLSEEISIPTLVIENKSEKEEFVEELLNKVYPSPANLKVFGITGTNGKSTCVSLCEQISIQQGKKSASLGTVGISINGEVIDLGVTGTTPSSIDLRRILFELSKKGIEYLFMEVSSHALVQKRLGSVKLSGGGWTSFSQDHLDFHSTMEEYFEAKALILENIKNGSLFIPRSQKDLLGKLSSKSESVKATSAIEEYNFSEIPMFFKVHYNVDNLEISLSLLSEEFPLEGLDLSKIKTPKGRFEILKAGKGYAVVDYAHTPDAIENLVEAAKKAFPSSKIYTLFGCGGDRDKTKRPLMAKAAEGLSDGVIVTSDNPRSEDPNEIIKDILKGLKTDPLYVSPDREEAIHKAIRFLDEDDVLLIAGKGHEEYQEIKGETIFFSDFSVVEKFEE